MLKAKSLIEKEEEWRQKSDSIPYRPTRGVFFGLLAFCTIALLIGGFLFWYIPSVGLVNIHPALPLIFGIGLAGTLFILMLGAIGLSIALLKGRDIFFSHKFRGVLTKVFLPLMIMAGDLLRIPRIKIEQSFIHINNQLVKGMGKRFRPEKLLILMPHCIQDVDCTLKVTQNVKNCARCGKCEIADLVELSDTFGIDLFISTGGTIARRKVYEKRPDAIVAVACERDLTSGIQDAYPMPVLAVVNKRPQGYCIGTGVDMKDVQDAIRDFLG